MAKLTHSIKQLETWITGAEIAQGSSGCSTDECVITAQKPLTLHCKQTRVWVSGWQKEIGFTSYHLDDYYTATSSSWAELQSLLLAHKFMNWNFILVPHPNLRTHSWLSIRSTAAMSDLFLTFKMKRKYISIISERDLECQSDHISLIKIITIISNNTHWWKANRLQSNCIS